MSRPRALITGAAGGLGKAFALECAARGYDLFLTDLDAAALATLAAGIRRQYAVSVDYTACDLARLDTGPRPADGGLAHDGPVDGVSLADGARPANVGADPAAGVLPEIDGLWRDIAARGLSFSLLVNVAGLDYEGEFCSIDAARLNHIVRLNIESAITMTRQVLVHREPGRRLHIINVSSLAAFNPMPVKAVYAASKRFLLDLSLALDRELAGRQVRVTALCPAGMPTNDACIRGIDAQGWAGRVTTVNVGTVAHRCLSRALAGRRVYVPGAINQAVRLLSGLLPRAAVTRLIYRRWCRS